MQRAPFFYINRKFNLKTFLFTAEELQKRRRRFNIDLINDVDEPESLTPPKKPRFERVLKPKTASPLRTDVGQKVNKLIIKNDTEDEEELRKDVEKSTQSRKRRHVSPVNFEVAAAAAAAATKVEGRKSAEPKTDSVEKSKDKHENNNSSVEQLKSSPVEHQKIKTSTLSNKKYEHLPSRKYLYFNWCAHLIGPSMTTNYPN